MLFWPVVLLRFSLAIRRAAMPRDRYVRCGLDGALLLLLLLLLLHLTYANSCCVSLVSETRCTSNDVKSGASGRDWVSGRWYGPLTTAISYSYSIQPRPMPQSVLFMDMKCAGKVVRMQCHPRDHKITS